MNIAALLSGGVDSSVAVHLLCEQGYRPDLFYIKIGMNDDGYSCPQEEDLEIVRAMAHRYGLHYDVVDLQKDYWDLVVEYTIQKVKRGFTPNPDVMCNRLIKFGAFDQKVGHLYDKSATGHYARIVESGDYSFLATTPDPVKDQTDFLAQLDGWQVSHSLFPIGDMAKGEVRRIAEEAKLPSAHRKDSQGICFLGKINYNQFIERFLGKKEGPIIEIETGKVLGTHQGFWFHTIGQRKGLYLSGGPWFVVKKEIEQNIIYVSRGYQPEAQMQDWLVMRDMHWITLDPFATPNLPAALSSLSSATSNEIATSDESAKSVDSATDIQIPVKFKIRHVAELHDAILTQRQDGSYFLQMEQKTNGVAPGQFCVIYTPNGQICLGSGEISWD